MAAWFVVVAIAAAAFAAMLVAYRSDITAARKRLAHGARIVQTACGPIEYAEVGEGAPILVVHGAGGGFDQGLDLAADLAREGFRVIAVSRFGYLGTPQPQDASAEAQARAHACLLDALGIERAAVLGASAGAPSAMQFALLYPSRAIRLILFVPAAYVPRVGNAPSVSTPKGLPVAVRTALKWDFVFWAGVRFAPGLFTRAILGTPPSAVAAASRDERQRVAMILRHVLPVSARRLGLINDGDVVSNIPRYPIESLRAPTLIFSAKDDLYGTYDCARYTANYIPNARFVGFQSGGHLMAGHQPEIHGEIAAFLR